MDYLYSTSLLGKNVSTPEYYQPELLFRIPRSENREKYNISERLLPFVGFDTWNCYEVSFLTQNGFPVSGMLKLIYPADSRFIVESKSLKLYLNSFNMERLEFSVDDSKRRFLDAVSNDVSRLLEVDVCASLLDANSEELTPFITPVFNNIQTFVSISALEEMKFSHFQEKPSLLKSKNSFGEKEYCFKTDLLRSNCRVTNQPDWGDLFVRIKTKHDIDFASVVEYLVSFRKENHFHEEVVEMIYKRFSDAFLPKKLMVAAMYTRRGGIDINPIRASHVDWIDEAFISAEKRLAKTLRQ